MDQKFKKISSALALTRRAFAKYKLQVFILTLLGFLSGIVEGIGVNALIPLFSFALKTEDYGTDAISAFLEKTFGLFHITFSVQNLLIFIILMFIVKAVATVVIQYIKIKISSDYEREAKDALFRRVLGADWQYLLKQKSGHLETVLMIDVAESATLLHQVSGAITVVTGLIIYTLIALNISFWVTVVTLVSGGAVFLIFKPVIRRINVSAAERVLVNKQTAHLVSEHIAGMKAIKSLLLDNAIADRGLLLFKKMQDLTVRLYILKSIPASFLPTVSVLFLSALFALSYKTPYFNLASLVAIVYLVNKIFTYVQQFQNIVFIIQSLVPHLRSVLNMLDDASVRAEKIEGQEPFLFSRTLELRNVHFNYDEGTVVLKDISLAVHKGDFIGVIGPSGAGKTTVVDILLRLLKPQTGEILVDGLPVSRIRLSDWRHSIGYIGQDMALVNDTIENNIRFYAPEISDEDIKKAALDANAKDFIEALPQSYKTVVGERGVMLSGGERQRIIIARILARKPQLLILDEATSALDNESEAIIQNVIHSLKGHVTVIAIAHRLSTIMNSDTLFVIQDGAIVEHGKPEELIKDRDSYFFKVNHIRS